MLIKKTIGVIIIFTRGLNYIIIRYTIRSAFFISLLDVGSSYVWIDRLRILREAYLFLF